MEDRLWNYIDGGGNATENTFVEQLIATQEAWCTRHQELLNIHQLLHSSLELEEPSMRFSQNVMEEIGLHQITPAATTYINKKIIYGIGLFFLVMILGMLIYGLGQLNWSGGDETTTGLLSTYNLRKIDFSKFFNNTFTTIFMLINVVLGLMLLDMWLGKKRKGFQEKNA
ncbi:MAG: hypothetical protein ABI813_10735 [Bacteroidota bacterium]